MQRRPLSVLLVEDSAPLAELIRTWLVHMGDPAMDVHHVSRLAAALDHLEGARVDATLLDLSLPDSTGLDTLRRLMGHAAHVPILVLTGETDPETAIGAVRLGAQDYLLKAHMDDASLRRSIVYAVERHRRSRDPGGVSRVPNLQQALGAKACSERYDQEEFQDLVSKYVEVLSAEEKGGLGQADRSESLASVAAALRRLEAGPDDVLALHFEGLRHVQPGEAGAVTERDLLLELMGRLVTAYRGV